MKIGSLFSGIGGIELGFEREGFETKWFVEKNLFCQAVLRKHWPKVKIYGDITSIDFRKTEPIDVLTGGFPCQDISVAGKGKGITGERSGLWKEYLRAIREIQPKLTVIENVSELTNKGLDVVLANLAEAGYDAEWCDLRAADFGAFHRRERIFIIAYSYSNGFSSSRECSKERSLQSTQSEYKECSSLSPVFFTNDISERIQRFKQETIQGKQGFSWGKDVRRVEDFFGRPDIPEPLIRRASDGVSNKSYKARIKSIGNAVVPQVAQFVARRIKEVSSNG